MNFTSVLSYLKKSKLALAVGALILGLAIGKYTLPTKTITKEVVVEKEVIVEKTVFVKETEKAKNTSEKKTTKVVTKPDGTKIEETTTNTDTSSTEKTKDTGSSESKKEKEKTQVVEKTETRKNLSVSALLGLKFSGDSADRFKNPIYGVHVKYNAFGPVSVGLFGLTTKEAGFSVGLDL